MYKVSKHSIMSEICSSIFVIQPRQGRLGILSAFNNSKNPRVEFPKMREMCSSNVNGVTKTLGGPWLKKKQHGTAFLRSLAPFFNRKLLCKMGQDLDIQDSTPKSIFRLPFEWHCNSILTFLYWEKIRTAPERITLFTL